MSFVRSILNLLREASDTGQFRVDYYAQTTTPIGARCRFAVTASRNQLATSGSARSETAVLAYLRKRHPGCEITIVDVNFF